MSASVFLVTSEDPIQAKIRPELNMRSSGFGLSQEQTHTHRHTLFKVASGNLEEYTV